jgi:hypothetical protein
MRAMEAREIVGQLPVLATRTPLIIAYAGSCEMTTCGAVLLSMGAAGAYVLPMDIAETRVLSGPLVLSELPLEHWTRDSQYGGQPRVRVLDAAERKVAADAIDYVIFTRAYHLTEPGPFDELLRRNPTWQDLGEDVTLRLAMAPLPKGVGRVVFAELAFDLVDLWSLRKRYAAPLFTGRWIEPSNSLAGTETVAAAVCPQDLDDWDCRRWLYY